MEFKAKVKKLKITAADGTVYEMRCPSIGDLESLQSEIESAQPKDAMKVYIKFFEGLGLPESASKQFDSEDFTEFITFVLNPKKKLSSLALQKAKLVRFYGLTFNDVEALSLTDFADLYSAIEKLEARELMMSYKAADWPNVKDKARAREWAKLEKLAGLESNKAKKVTNEELKQFLGGSLMAIDNKVSIEIILDDGSVKRGFATIKKEADSTAKDIEKNLDDGVEGGFAGLNAVKGKFLLAAAAAAAAGVAIKKSLDSALRGEQVDAIRAQFDNLAQSAGLSGQILRSQFEDVGQGLVDIEDVLQRASVRVTQLGNNAARLPDILDAARRVAFATGQDVGDTFDTLANGIATGNARALRQLGIIVDLDKATKDYAASIGIGVNNLTEQQRQAAALEATVAKINERFGGVDQSIRPLNDSLTRLREAGNEALDNLGRTANALFGPGFQAVANALTATLERFSDTVKAANPTIEGTQARVRLLTAEIERLENIINNSKGLQNANAIANEGGIGRARERVVQYRKEIEILGATVRALEEDQRRSNLASEADAIIKDQQALAAQRLQQQTQNRAALLQQEIAFAQQEIQILQQKVAATAIIEDQELLQKQIREQQRALIALQSEQQLDQIRKTFTAEAGFNAAERARLETEAANNAKEQLKLIEEEKLANQKAANEEYLKNQQRATNAIAGINNALNQTVSAGLQRLGAQLVQGGKAWDGFGKQVLGIIGDLLVNVGQSFISIGLGLDSLKAALLKISGGAAIAAGIALVVLGGALKAAAGGALTSAATGGGSSAITSPVTETTDSLTTPVADNERSREPNTVINVSFEGDVIGDSADTGARIVSLINNAFDRQGVVLRQGVV